MQQKPHQWVLAICASFLLSNTTFAADWIHWRGPNQNGTATGQKLPESFDISTPGKGNLIWKQPIGGRSAPIVMNGRLFFMCGYDSGKLTEGEQIVCMNADTGKIEWEHKFGVFHTDIVSSRLGWSTLTADPKAGIVYASTTAGFLFALKAEDGKVVWERQLTEEFGRVTGYGGRISSPIYDSGLVICGIVSGAWVDQGRGHNRFYGFDASNGKLVWITSPTEELKQASITLRGTYYSNPVIAVIKGQRLVISGGADGCIHAFKVRTGERVWSHHFASGVVNPSPIVDGNFVYACHGEENPGGGTLGRVVCLDASKVKDMKPEVVWDNNKLARRFGLATPALSDGKLYVPEDGGELYCFNAKTGKLLWKYKYGTVARGAPLIVDGRMYIFEVFGKMTQINKLGNTEPDVDDDAVEYRFRPKQAGTLLETNGTPIAVNGKLYFHTLDETYCVGAKDVKVADPKPLDDQETPFDAKAEPKDIMIYPAEAIAAAGEALKFEVRFVDANGRVLPTPAAAKVEWSFPQPPLPATAPKGANAPPALKAKAEASGSGATITLDKVPPAQHGVVVATSSKLTSKARIRVIPQIPFKQDFTNIPVGAPPSGWVNVIAKYSVAEVMVDGKPEKVLSKVNTTQIPPLARANAYMTRTDATDYTVQADLAGSEVNGKLPEMGVIANRYVLILDGKEDPEFNNKRVLRVVSWEARFRVAKAVEFDWKPDVWYRMKFTVEIKDGKGYLKGKVWDRKEKEPEAWTIEFVDPNPNPNGAAALYGYVSNVIQAEDKVIPGSTIYYDNVSVTPNAKK